ncbi:MAG: phage tail protein [Gemmobacter sp.]
MIWRAVILLLALAVPAHAGPVFFAVLSAGGGFGAAVAATAFGTFLTTTVGRLLITVAVSALSRALAPRPRDPGLQTRVTQAGGTNPASFILGRYATAGFAVCPPMSHGSNNNELTFVIDVSDLPVSGLARVVIDGEYAALGATPDGDGFRPLLGRFAGRGSVKFVTGGQTAADPWLLATYAGYPERPWSADMIGKGVAYAILRFSYNREVYQGLPQVRFEVDGIPLYDPRLDTTVGGDGPQRWADRATWAHTLNPAVMIYNIRRGIALPDGSVWGGDAPVELPLSSWFAAMNECDAGVDLGDATTEPQFRAGFEVTLDTEPAEVIEELQKACNGQIVETGGVCKLRVGPPALPVYFFTDDDVLVSRPQDLDPFPGLDQTFNAVHASYPEPESLWEARDAPPRYDAALEAEDGGRRLVADLRLPAVPYGSQVQRIMRALAADHRRMRRHSLSLPPEAAILEPLDTVAWTSARNGYIAKLFELGDVADEAMTLVQTIALREVDPGDYDWEPGFALPSEPVPAMVVAPPAAAVPGFGVVGTLVGDGPAGTRHPAILLSWDPSSLSGARGLVYEVRPMGGTTVVVTGQVVEADAGQAVVTSGIDPDTEYEVRARLLAEVPGDWTAWLAVTTPAGFPGIRALGEGDVSRRGFLSRWVTQTISSIGTPVGVTLGSTYGPGAYLGDILSPRNPVVGTLSATVRPLAATAGRIVFSLQADISGTWTTVATSGFGWPASAAEFYPARQIVFSLLHGSSALAQAERDYRLAAHLTTGSPNVEIENVVLLLEQVSR